MGEIDEGFNLSPQNVKIDKPNLLIFDVDHCMYIVGPNKKLTNSKGIPKLDKEGNFTYENKTLEETLDLADKYVNGVFARTKADYYIGFTTTGKNFRYTIYPEYKGNRKDVIKPPFYNEVKSYLMGKYKFTDYIGLEADDLVLIARKHYYDKYNCIIATTDKDILQCPFPTFDPKKHEWHNTSLDDAKYFFWKSMIVGDTADNIKGIPGRGESHAKKVLNNIDLPDHTFSEIILREYINHFGEEEGIRQFYVNYKILRMVENSPEGYVIPDVIKVNYE